VASYYWIKLYHEILDDPKMGRLSDHLWRRAIEMFLFAGKQGGNGEVPCVEDMAWSLRTTPAELQEDLDELERIGIICQGDGANPFVVHFEQRQKPASSTERSTRRRVRERKKQYDGATPIGPSRQTWRTDLYGDLPESPGVYVLRCAATGKCYVGASINVRSRIKAHLTEMSTLTGHPLYHDFQEHGHESIGVEILETTDDPRQLKGLETQYQQAAGQTYNRETAKRNGYWVDRECNEPATNRCTELDQSRVEKELEEDNNAAGAAPSSAPTPAEVVFLEVFGPFAYEQDRKDILAVETQVGATTAEAVIRWAKRKRIPSACVIQSIVTAAGKWATGPPGGNGRGDRSSNATLDAIAELEAEGNGKFG